MAMTTDPGPSGHVSAFDRGASLVSAETLPASFQGSPYSWRGLKRLGRFLRDALPDGGRLPEQSWIRRHQAIVLLAWVQALFVPVFGFVRGAGLLHSLFEGAVVATPAAVAIFARKSRKLGACAATFSLLSASGVLTHLSGGSIEMHFHFFVMLAVISLYQDWTPFLLAIGFVLAHHGIIGALDPNSVFNHPAARANPWKWAAIHALFVSGSCLVSVVAWKFNEKAREEAEMSYRLLYEGERAVVDQLRETQRAKEELLSIVSHEFRTPVTSIFGFAKVLAMQGPALSDEDRRDFNERIMAQSERLKVMIENLLSASRPINPQFGSETNVVQAVNSVVQQLSDQAPKKGMWFEIQAPADLEVGVGAEPLQLVLMNLISNAIKYGDRATPIKVEARNGVELSGDLSAPAVELSVTNSGTPIPAGERTRIFEPFVQLDSTSTRSVGGVGLGLHIVRRVIDACGGDVRVDGEDGTISFTVRLPMPALKKEPEAVS